MFLERYDDALRVGEQTVEAASSINGWVAVIAARMLGQAQRAARDPDECVRLLLDAGGGSDLGALDASMRPEWFRLLVQAELARGRLDEAACWAERAEATAAATGLTGRVGYALLARAELLIAQGDPSGAADKALAAAASFAKLGSRPYEGYAHLLARAGARRDRCQA